MFAFRPLLALLPLCLIIGFAAQATNPTSLRVQITDAHGVPVRDAVVELKPQGASTGSIRFPWRMAMAQKDEQFVPGTLIVPKGSTVAFPNLDRVRHSIYSFSKIARFEIELYGRDQTRSRGFPLAGSVKLGCNIHDEMRGYIRVTETPFAGKTDGNGYVTLSSVPQGAAELVVWHPLLRAPANEHKETVNISSALPSRKIVVKLR